MSLRFSQIPGRRERQLLRKRDNPLFSEQERQISPARLDEAQRLDHEEIVAFIPRFRGLVVKASQLQPNEGSEVLIELKEQLDRCYEEACGLADDQRETLDAIEKLVALIMAAIRKGAGNDTLALAELDQEEAARKAHFSLVSFPLVADLLHPESPISPDELAASLLSSSGEELEAALQIFDGEQIAQLLADAGQLLATVDGPDRAHAANLERIRDSLARQQGQ
jgi:hypothetical protein